MDKYITVSITHRMYGWTKYGGAREGLVKEDLDIWYCQICGEKEVRVLPCYMFPMDDSEREYVRVCTRCKAKSIIQKITKLEDLLLELKT